MSPGSDITAARFVALSELAGFDLPRIHRGRHPPGLGAETAGELVASHGKLRGREDSSPPIIFQQENPGAVHEPPLRHPLKYRANRPGPLLGLSL